MPRTMLMLHRTRYQLQRAARRADTIVRVIVRTPREFRCLYRHIPLFDYVEYREIPKQNTGFRFSGIPENTVTRFKRTIFYKIPTVPFSTTVPITACAVLCCAVLCCPCGAKIARNLGSRNMSERGRYGGCRLPTRLSTASSRSRASSITSTLSIVSSNAHQFWGATRRGAAFYPRAEPSYPVAEVVTSINLLARVAADSLAARLPGRAAIREWYHSSASGTTRGWSLFPAGGPPVSQPQP